MEYEQINGEEENYNDSFISRSTSTILWDSDEENLEELDRRNEYDITNSESNVTIEISDEEDDSYYRSPSTILWDSDNENLEKLERRS